MTEEILQLLDVLRENKLSRLVFYVREKILHILNSDKFSNSVHRYMDIENINADGEPYTNFSHEPAQISQLKKIINALYHAELALKDAETVDLRAYYRDYLHTPGRVVTDMSTVYQHGTIHHAYQACYLATHFDIDLREMFSQELDVLAPLYKMFLAFTDNVSEETRGYFSQIDRHTLPHTMGVAGGTVIAQLDPRSPEIDYEFLALFSAKIPKYLDELRGYIQRFSSSVSEFEPNINQRELEALRDNALQLLRALDQTHGSHLFLPIKALHYIHIIRQIIKLSTSIFEQAGHLSEAGQDAACDKLVELKYKLLPTLFGLIDKIEANAMLAPGVLSNPLMDCTSRLYQTLIEYTSKFVEFKQKGQSLVTIEDSKFVAERLEFTHQRSMEHHYALLLTEQVKSAAEKFFQLLREHNGNGRRIIDLPERIKQELATYYKIIRPDVLQFNKPLSNAIVSGLTDRKGYYDALGTPSTWFNRSLNTNKISHVLLLQPVLQARLDKITTSHKFQIQLNNDLIVSITERIEDLRLFPHNPRHNPFVINEANTLSQPITNRQALRVANTDFDLLQLEAGSTPDHGLNDLDDLTKLKLYRLYQTNCLKLERAHLAYDAFYQILRDQTGTSSLADIDDELKSKLRNLYSIFQSYLVGGLIFSEDVDKTIVNALSKTTDASLQPVIIESIIAYDEQVGERFIAEKQRLYARHEICARAMLECNNDACQEKELITDASNAHGAHELLRDYSRSIAEFRQSLYQLKALFNPSVQSQLNPADIGLPFPELEDLNQKLAQSGQALGLKQLFNCLYYLEKALGRLAELSDESYKFFYFVNVLKIGADLEKARSLLEALIATPYLMTVAGDIQQKWQNACATLGDVRRHYIPDGELANLSRDHSAVLFYTLNVAMVLPEHIIASRHNQVVSPDRVDAMHQYTEKVTTDIERIHSHSSSYFKLFFDIPTMYRLFGQLKTKLVELSTASHDVVVDNLAFINNQLLTNMLLEADLWEDNIGLIPGTLTDTIKEMFDAFYQGLLEPLGLKSKRHIELATSTYSVDQRLLAVDKRVNASIDEQSKIAAKQTILRDLCKSIDTYHVSRNHNQIRFDEIKRAVIDSFQRALPILKEVKTLLDADVPADRGDSVVLDTLLNNSVVGEPPLKNIKELTAAGASYFQGKHASYQLMIDAGKQKEIQLIALKDAQQVLKDEFIERYTKTCFQNHAKQLDGRPTSLRYCRREYNSRLREYIDGVEANVVLRAKTTDDIDKTVGRLLRANVRAFKEENDKKYADLDEIMAAISRLSDYVVKARVAEENNDFSFENDTTLRTKVEFVRRLEWISLNETLPITDKLGRLKDFIERPTFETQMTAHHHYESFTYFWLKQCVIKLVELIGLYTPEHKKCYKRLLNAVNPPSATVSQSGFFSTRRPQPTDDIPLVDADRVQPVLA
jgi:hypothetical protein